MSVGATQKPAMEAMMAKVGLPGTKGSAITTSISASADSWV
jgi:hypothetical protein